MVAGYGKGKWSRQGDKEGIDGGDGGDGNTNKDLPYKLSTDTEEVLFNGALHTLRQLLMEKRKQDPEASPQASGQLLCNCCAARASLQTFHFEFAGFLCLP